MKNFKLVVNDPDEEVAYLELPGHPVINSAGELEEKSAAIVKNVRLHDLIGTYDGPDIYLDFNKDNRLVGIELLL